MKKVKIKTNEEIENNSCSLYDNNGKYIGEITSGLILTDVCVQIKEQSLTGYYIMFEGIKIEIEKGGRIMWKTENPFPAAGDMLRKLIYD